MNIFGSRESLKNSKLRKIAAKKICPKTMNDLSPTLIISRNMLLIKKQESWQQRNAFPYLNFSRL